MPIWRGPTPRQAPWQPQPLLKPAGLGLGGTQFNLTVSCTQAQSLTLVEQLALIRGLNFTVAQSLTLGKQANLIRSLTQAQSLALGKQITLIRSITQAQSVSLVAQKVFLIARSVTQAQLVSLSQQARLSRAITQAQALTGVTRANLSRTIAQAQVLTLVQGVRRTLALTQAQLTLTLGKFPRLTRTLGQAQTLTLAVSGGHSYPFTRSVSSTTSVTLSYTLLVLPGPTGTAVISQAPAPGSATSNYQDWPVLIVRPGEAAPPVGEAIGGP